MRVSLPQNQAAINWTFGKPFTRLRFVLNIPNLPTDPSGNPSQKGIYIILYDQRINDTPTYIGLQTNLMKPASGGGHIATNSFGLLFSRWESRDNSDARVAQEGFLENAPHEGGFIGVRMPMKFEPGQYEVELKSGKVDGKYVWYDCVVTHPTEGKIDCGSLRFPLLQEQDRGFNDHGGTNIELYRTDEKILAMPLEEVPQWTVSILEVEAGDQMKPQTAKLVYPFREATLANVGLNDKSGIVEIELGQNVIRKNEDGKLF